MNKSSNVERNGIYIVGHNKVVIFARDQLAAYLKIMTGCLLQTVVRMKDACFLLGTFDDLADMLGSSNKNDRWNDAVFMKSISGRLILSGPNGRSVLFSVYAYLESLGCRWLYPSTEGEYVPTNIELRTDGYDCRETPSYRFRGMMAYPLNFEEGRDLIDWMAKRRMNYYYQEGFPDDHPCRHGMERVSAEEKSKSYLVRELVLKEARKRGLIINRFGHGWLDGVVDMFAKEKHISFDEAQKALCAKGTSEKTKQLCMSDPDVQSLLVRHVCEFLERHKDEQDIIAVYMGDECDDVCRCERCKSRHFSAWYLDAIRQVAERIKQIAPDQIIEYAGYGATVGAPNERLIDHHDNLIMVFADLGRCYRHALRDPTCRHANWKPDFEHHLMSDFSKYLKPRNADIIDAYRAWRKDVPPPRYYIDYFNFVISKPGYHVMAYLPDTLAEDIRGYAKEQLEGAASCQECRAAFPTNLVSETFARLLWKKTEDVHVIRSAYLKDLFGPWSQSVEQHMDAMRKALLNLIPDEDLYVQQSTEIVIQVAAALDVIHDRFNTTFPPEAFRGIYAARMVRLKADLLFYHMLFKMLAACRNKQDEQLPACAEEAQTYIRKHINEIEVVARTKPFLFTPDQIKQAKFIKEAKFGWV